MNIQCVFTRQANIMEFEVREPLKSHTITVHSAGQNPADFLAELPNSINLPRSLYEIGLVECRIFKQNAVAEESDEENTPAAASTQPFFPNIQPPTKTHLQYIYETQDDIVSFMVHINEACERSNFPMEINAQYPGKNLVIFVMTVKCPIGHYLVLPDEITNVFGFERRFYSPGTFLSENIVMDDVLTYMQDRESYDFQTVEFPYDKNLIEIERRCGEMITIFKEEETYQKFVSDVAEEISRLGYELTLELDKAEHVKLTFKSVNRPDEYIRLPYS